MFCYNCGNQATENTHCPFCNKFLPALNATKVQHSLDVLNKQQNAEDSIDDSRDGYDDFLSGEMEFESIAQNSGSVLKAYEHYKIAGDKGIGEASNMMGVSANYIGILCMGIGKSPILLNFTRKVHIKVARRLWQI